MDNRALNKGYSTNYYNTNNAGQVYKDTAYVSFIKNVSNSVIAPKAKLRNTVYLDFNFTDLTDVDILQK